MSQPHQTSLNHQTASKKTRKKPKMVEENNVVLHGMWASPYAKRVELALKIKGISFEYVEEDLRNKSDLLLKYNPVYKKVPVLVHNGNKHIAESLVIIEYIDETWKNDVKLLPDDVYEKAKVRFWAGFIQQVLESTMKVFKSEGEEQQKALDEVHDKLTILEEGMKEFFPSGKIPEDHGNHLGLLDILMIASLGAFKIQEEILEVKMIDPEKTPFIYEWVTSLIELPVVKEVAPPPEKLIAFLQFIKKNKLFAV